MNQKALVGLVRSFALEQSGEFELSALLKHVQKIDKDFDDDDGLYDLACHSPYLFEASEDFNEDLFMPRHQFFQGAELRITPAKDEVQGGYLMPGHRFMPYISADVFPAEVALKQPDGSVVPTRTIQLSFDELYKYFTFYGQHGMLHYLVLDDETNEKRLVEQALEAINVTVFDLKAFYEQSGFAPGDTLLLKVEDWLKGVLSIKHLPAKAEGLDLPKVREWAGVLRAGYEEARMDDHLSHDCGEQMARMFWYGEIEADDGSVLTDPPLSIAAFFNMQEDLVVRSMGEVSFIWPKDEPVESRLVNMLERLEPRPESELDAFFMELGISVDTQEVEAYMRDALGNGELDPVQVLARVARGRDFSFASEKAGDIFFQLWQELWEEVCSDYIPGNDPHRQMRSMVLELNDECLSLMRKLDKNMSDPAEFLGNPATMQIAEISSMIHGMVVLCNDRDADAVKLPLPLDQMAAEMKAAINELADQLLVGTQAIHVISDAPIYQLKISLKGAKPPIWRRILIDSSMSLDALHGVIQAAFGWQCCHLHQFRKGQLCYQPEPEDEGFMGVQIKDSAGVRVADLLRSEKDKIGYEYDFGDSWDHEVRLEKVLPHDPAQTLPICIKGKRACPPEDCGGLWGYYHMLETLSGPDSAEKSDLLEWCGPIDPEAFDLAEANARLTPPF